MKKKTTKMKNKNPMKTNKQTKQISQIIISNRVRKQQLDVSSKLQL